MVVATEAPAASSDRYVVVDGPFGPLFVAFGEHGLTRVAPAEPGPAELERQYELQFGRRLARAPAPPTGLLAALRAGSPRGLAVDLRALSAFGRAVLDVTALIPRGEVRTYAWVAGEMGRPRAVRAVGSALARNPLPVVIPCHRVVRSDGQVGEYAFGTAIKRALLEQEGAGPRAEGSAPVTSGSAR
jgi:methylated-DNA-[protein]-cysteine S-methyltransferase